MYFVFTGEEPLIVDARTNLGGHTNIDTVSEANAMVGRHFINKTFKACVQR